MSYSSNRPADGGIQRGGSLGEGTQTNPHAITNSVPRPVSSLGFAVNSRAQQREFFIDLREFATSLFLIGFAALVVVLVALGRAAYLTLVP